MNDPNVLAALFARDGATWAEIEHSVKAILADEAHPHYAQLRGLLSGFGYDQRTVHGMRGLAAAMRAAEERVTRMRAVYVREDQLERDHNAAN